RLFAQAGVVCIVSFVSPMRSERDRARKITESEDSPRIPFLEIYLSGPNDVSSQYEPPDDAEVLLSEADSLDERVNKALEAVMRQIRYVLSPARFRCLPSRWPTSRSAV